MKTMRETQKQLKRIADLLELNEIIKQNKENSNKLKSYKYKLHEQTQRANGYKEGYKHQKQYVIKLENKLKSIIRTARQ
tara:strand:+ start:275 stop:511 length:237 start_codon:yes stop_codon:yes gene_type:complete